MIARQIQELSFDSFFLFADAVAPPNEAAYDAARFDRRVVGQFGFFDALRLRGVCRNLPAKLLPYTAQAAAVSLGKAQGEPDDDWNGLLLRALLHLLDNVRIPLA